MFLSDLYADFPEETPAQSQARRQANTSRAAPTYENLAQITQGLMSKRIAASDHSTARQPTNSEPVPQTASVNESETRRIPGLSIGINA